MIRDIYSCLIYASIVFFSRRFYAQETAVDNQIGNDSRPFKCRGFTLPCRATEATRNSQTSSETISVKSRCVGPPLVRIVNDERTDRTATTTDAAKAISAQTIHPSIQLFNCIAVRGDSRSRHFVCATQKRGLLDCHLPTLAMNRATNQFTSYISNYF